MIAARGTGGREATPAVDNLIFSQRSPRELAEQFDSFHRLRELRRAIHRDHPGWQPTEAQRFVVGQIRDIGARLHPDTLQEAPLDREPAAGALDLSRASLLDRARAKVSRLFAPRPSLIAESAEGVLLLARAELLFERSFRNLARYHRGEPLEATVDGELRALEVDSVSPGYEGEFLSSLWATRASFYAFRDNKELTQSLFATMRRHLPDLLVICTEEKNFNAVFGTILAVSARSDLFRRILLDQEIWLGIRAVDLPPRRGGIVRR